MRGISMLALVLLLQAALFAVRPAQAQTVVEPYCEEAKDWPVLFRPPGDVEVMDGRSWFAKKVETKGVWYVQMYTEWCGICQNREPTYKRLATEVKNLGRSNLHVAAVTCTCNPTLCERHNVEYYPTYILFSEAADGPVRVSGGKSNEELMNMILAEANKLQGEFVPTTTEAVIPPTTTQMPPPPPTTTAATTSPPSNNGDAAGFNAMDDFGSSSRTHTASTAGALLVVTVVPLLLLRTLYG